MYKKNLYYFPWVYMCVWLLTLEINGMGVISFQVPFFCFAADKCAFTLSSP